MLPPKDNRFSTIVELQRSFPGQNQNRVRTHASRRTISSPSCTRCRAVSERAAGHSPREEVVVTSPERITQHSTTDDVTQWWRVDGYNLKYENVNHKSLQPDMARQRRRANHVSLLHECRSSISCHYGTIATLMPARLWQVISITAVNQTRSKNKWNVTLRWTEV